MYGPHFITFYRFFQLYLEQGIEKYRLRTGKTVRIWLPDTPLLVHDYHSDIDLISQ